MSTESRERFADVVRHDPQDLGTACLLIAAEATGGSDGGLDTELESGLARLDDLALHVPSRGTDDERLRVALESFHGEPTDYADLRSSLLPEVLDRRRGLPILLSVVWLEVARRTGIAAAGIGVPGHFVVAVGTDATEPLEAPADGVVVVDPWRHGQVLGLDEARVIGARSGDTSPDDVVLQPYAPVQIVERILANIRTWADRPERWSTALWSCELALLLPRHAATLRRERGELLIRTGRFVEGAGELDEYADAVEGADATGAEDARTRARLARSRLN